MLSYRTKTKLIKALQNNREFPKILDKIMYNVAYYLVVPEYKKQSPVDKGNLRKSVDAKRLGNFHYLVTTTATSEGYRYPIVVHEGSGRYRNSLIDYGTLPEAKPSFSRNANYPEELLILFQVLKRKGYEFNRRPNKFAKRTYEQSKKRINEYIINQINKYLS